MSGYLKAVSNKSDGMTYECDLQVPNKEVASFFNSIIKSWLSGVMGFVWYKEFMTDLATGRVEQFAEKLQTLIISTFNCHDVTVKSQERFYHDLMLGFIVGLKDTHEIKSNRESGRGRYDVAIIPKDTTKLGIIMEFKAITNAKKLGAEAKTALKQIKKSHYVAELQNRGITKICQMGIAFIRKNVKVVV